MPLIYDSITVVPADARGKAVLAASHGANYVAYLAAKAGLKAAIFCDAGVGRGKAGIDGLDMLNDLGVPAATVGHRSARIGDGKDCHARGVISNANRAAEALGVHEGAAVRAALALFDAATLPPSPPPKQEWEESRQRIAEAERGDVQVIALDSNGLVTPDDAGHIVVTGSHGGLLGGRPETAVKYPVFAAIYNDAGFGADDAGISRLPALQARGIAGLTVSNWSAYIGDALSTYRDGYITAMNQCAADCAVRIGDTAREAVMWLVGACELKREGKK